MARCTFWRVLPVSASQPGVMNKDLRVLESGEALAGADD